MKNNILKLFFFILLLLSNLKANNVLSLSEAYYLALLNSNDVKFLDYQLKISDEKVTQVKSRLQPQVSLSSSFVRDTYDVDSDLGSQYDYRTQKKYADHTVTVRQVLYDLDVFSQIDVEESKRDLTKTRVSIEKQELIKKILEIYIEILKSQNKIGLYQSYLKFNEIKLDSTKTQYKMELSNKMDLLDAKINFNNAKVDLKNEENKLKLNKLKLSYLTGDSNYEFPLINFDKKLNKDFITKLKTQIKDIDLSMNNLKIKQAKDNLDVNKNEIKSSKSNHTPKVYLQGQYSYHTNQKKIMMMVDIPIYQGGYASSKVTEAKLNYFASQEELEKTKKDINSEYEERLLNFNTNLDALIIYNDSLSFSKTFIEYVEQSCKSGLKSLVDLYEANNKLYEVKSKYLDTVYNVVDNYVGLLILSNNLDNLNIVDSLLN